MLPKISAEMRVVGDPTLRFTPGGMAVAEFRAVANSRKKEGDEWVDDKSCWLTIVTFKKQAENVAESVVDKCLVTVTGNLQTENYETREGEKRTAYKVLADTVGIALTFNAAKVVSGVQGGGGAVTRTSGGGEDPFATPAPAASGGDEPPF